MPHNYKELEALLELTSEYNRNTLGAIIDTPFGNAPSLLCDHLSYLKAGMLGQIFDSRDYKQLVTDIADRIKLDWSHIIKTKCWSDLSSEEIEAAIIAQIDPEREFSEDTERHIPDGIANFISTNLRRLIIRHFPVASCCDTVFEDSLDYVFGQLSTDWRKLLSALIFIHTVIRRETEKA